MTEGGRERRERSGAGWVERLRAWWERRYSAAVIARPTASDPDRVLVELEFPLEGITHRETVQLEEYGAAVGTLVRIARLGRDVRHVEIRDLVATASASPANTSRASPPGDEPVDARDVRVRSATPTAGA